MTTATTYTGRSITATDGRKVTLYRIPEGYGMIFRNADGKEARVALSDAALCALVRLWIEDHDADAAIIEDGEILFGRPV